MLEAATSSTCRPNAAVRNVQGPITIPSLSRGRRSRAGPALGSRYYIPDHPLPAPRPEHKPKSESGVTALSKRALFTEMISTLQARFYEISSGAYGAGAALLKRGEDGSPQPQSDGANSTRADPPNNSTRMIIRFHSV